MIINYFNGFQETQSERLERILPMLACTRCRGILTMQPAGLLCQICGVLHPIRGGVPILLPQGVPDGGAVGLSEKDRVSRHPYSVRAEEIIESHESGWVLDLGAGGKFDRRKNVVQIDIFRYPAVDVVGSADCLPFSDNSFDAVISQAVFEHLQYPEWAVREIRRVLKPGGIAKIDTAFLQPEHGYPHHFYNATETGLLHWFRDFEIQWSGVEPFQHPKWALHWFLGVYLDFIGTEQADFLRNVSVGNLLDALQRHSTQQTTSEDLSITSALDAMPEHFLRVLAAGVSVHAINPPKHPVGLNEEMSVASSSLDREREMAQLRIEGNILNARVTALNESLAVAQKKAEYLAQFYPSSSNLAQFVAAWVDPLHLRSIGLAASDLDPKAIARPFATIIVRPTAISPLLDTFFSLTAQVFGGWELFLVTGSGTGLGVTKAANALARLDQRVTVFQGDSQAFGLQRPSNPSGRGKYWICLPQGATFSLNALVEVVTVARHSPSTVRIGFDFDRALPGAAEPMRCHSQAAGMANYSSNDPEGFSPWFELSGQKVSDTSESLVDWEYAHIFQPLVHLSSILPDGEESHRASLVYLLEQHREVCEELQQMNVESPTAARELRQLNLDVSNYLAQFYFDQSSQKRLPMREAGLFRWVRQKAGLWLRTKLSLHTLTTILGRQVAPRSTQVNDHADRGSRPFATILLEPENAIALIGTIFSLVHQTYTGWELVLIQNEEQSPAVRRAIKDFSELDKRVVVFATNEPRDTRWAGAKKAARGEYILELCEGVTLAFGALEEVVTLVRAAPDTRYVVCDFDYVSDAVKLPMRCHNVLQLPADQNFSTRAGFSSTFVSTAFPDPQTHAGVGTVAHLPRSLFHLMARGPG